MRLSRSEQSLVSFFVLDTREEKVGVGFLVTRLTPTLWRGCWVRVVNFLLSGQEGMNKFKLEGFGFWAETFQVTYRLG